MAYRLLKDPKHYCLLYCHSLHNIKTKIERINPKAHPFYLVGEFRASKFKHTNGDGVSWFNTVAIKPIMSSSYLDWLYSVFDILVYQSHVRLTNHHNLNKNDILHAFVNLHDQKSVTALTNKDVNGSWYSKSLD